jgi:teichuronic acid biosynthesis glycosyltransferase TuaG
MSSISVIIPYYKKNKFIDKAIKSVLNQSYKKFEIILIYDDDDKYDLKLIKKISKKNKKIRLIVNKKNIGAGYSRNIGIKNSKGKFIAFLDADDYWHHNKLEKQLDFMKKKSIKISHTSYKIINNDNSVINLRNAKFLLDHNSLLKDCEIGLSTVMIDKKFFKNKIKFPKLKTKEDFVLWLELSKISNIYGLNTYLSYWRNTENSLSKNLSQKILDGFRVYNNYMGFSFFKSVYYLCILSFRYLKKNI